jgi:hypothetical protein
MEGRHKMAANTEKTKMVLSRIMAVFAASGLSVIGAGAIAGVELTQAILMAGIGGVATVVEGLSRAYLQDGKLTAAEIDDVFASVDKKTSRKAAAASSK